jgi:hypothetical protein
MSTMNLNKSIWIQRKKQVIGSSIENCFVDIGVCNTRLKVYVTAIGMYDLIIGMD